MPYPTSSRAGVDRRRFIGSWHTRTARTYGILGLEIRDDRISGDRPDREPQKGRTRDDRLSGLHGLECSVLGLDGRWFATGVISEKGGEDDECRGGSPPHCPRNLPAQEIAADGV